MTWNEHLFFTSGVGEPRWHSFRVIVQDGETELARERVVAEDSGQAADTVLNRLQHPCESRLELAVTQL